MRTLALTAALLLSIAFPAFADVLIDETFDESGTYYNTGGAAPTEGYLPGNVITGTSALSVVPVNDPAYDSAVQPPLGQPYVELLPVGSPINGFSTPAVDLNQMGIQFSFTVSAAETSLDLTFDSAIDNSGDVRYALADIYSTLAPSVAVEQFTGPSTTNSQTSYSFDSNSFTLAPGSYVLQLSSNAYSDYRGVQVTNVLLLSAPEPAPVILFFLGIGLIAFHRARRRAGY
jgi:hypothetical protein